MPSQNDDKRLKPEHVKHLLELAKLIDSVLTPEERRQIREQANNE